MHHIHFLNDCHILPYFISVSSVSLDYVVDFFKVKLCHPSDSAVSVTDVMAWLLDLFINEQNRSMPTVDLILNWLFNVFDSYVRSLGLKVSLSIIQQCTTSLAVADQDISK